MPPALHATQPQGPHRKTEHVGGVGDRAARLEAEALLFGVFAAATTAAAGGSDIVGQ